MDLQSLLCGLNPTRTRNSTKKKSKERKAKRKHLPLPTGEFTVGSVDIVTGYGKEGLFLRLYYPTNTADIVDRESEWPLWLPDKRYGLGYVYFRRCSTKIHGRFFNFLGGDVYSPTLHNAPIHRGSERYPVLLFSHGLGGNRTTCSTAALQLASHGFIVASIEHRDGSASMTYLLRDPVNNNNRGEDQGYGDQLSASEVKVRVGSGVNSKVTGHGEVGSEVEMNRNASATRYNEAETTSDGKKSKEYKVKMEDKGPVQWWWYEKQENEEDFEVRNKQVKMRSTELQRLLDLLESLDAGEDVVNLLSPDFDLKQLQGRLDLGRVASVGHSFGATSAIAVAGQDSRIKCCLAYDVWMMPFEPYMYASLDKPLLLLTTEKFGWYDNMKLMMEELKPNQEHNQTTMITIRDTCHQSFSDFQFLVPKSMGKHLWLVDEMKPTKAMEIIGNASRGFLNKILDIPGPLHEDIMTAQHEFIMAGTTVDLSKPPAKKEP